MTLAVKSLCCNCGIAVLGGIAEVVQINVFWDICPRKLFLEILSNFSSSISIKISTLKYSNKFSLFSTNKMFELFTVKYTKSLQVKPEDVEGLATSLPDSVRGRRASSYFFLQARPPRASLHRFSQPSTGVAVDFFRDYWTLGLVVVSFAVPKTSAVRGIVFSV